MGLIDHKFEDNFITTERDKDSELGPAELGSGRWGSAWPAAPSR
jgi:hypothetical protein